MVWTRQHAEGLAVHLERQQFVTPNMRRLLMNWLLEVHLGYWQRLSFREPILHLTVQLVCMCVCMCVYMCLNACCVCVCGEGRVHARIPMREFCMRD